MDYVQDRRARLAFFEVVELCSVEIVTFVPEVQRQEAAASAQRPGRATENSPGQAGGRSLARRSGSAFRPILRLPRIARIWAIQGERLGEGAFIGEWQA